MLCQSKLEIATTAKIRLNGSREMYHLLTVWDCEIQIILIKNDEIWKGSFTPDKLEYFSDSLDMSREDYDKHMKIALSTDFGSFDFIYDLVDEKIFSWKKLMKESVSVKYGTVDLTEYSPNGGTDFLVETLFAMKRSIEGKLKIRDDEAHALSRDLQQMIEKVHYFSQKKIEMEEDIYSKCMTLINTKKQKISCMEEFIADVGLDKKYVTKLPALENKDRHIHSISDSESE